jgi:hypothetical protein
MADDVDIAWHQYLDEAAAALRAQAQEIERLKKELAGVAEANFRHHRRIAELEAEIGRLMTAVQKS